MSEIEKNMLIGEIIEDHPEVIETLLENGVHCVGCHISDYETLEQGLSVHGYSEERIDKIVKELNEVVKDFEENAPAK